MRQNGAFASEKRSGVFYKNRNVTTIKSSLLQIARLLEDNLDPNENTRMAASCVVNLSLCREDWEPICVMTGRFPE
jgi:hypothetical protein